VSHRRLDGIVFAACLALAAAALAGCGGSKTTAPTPPSGGAADYQGQWAGTTSQGRPISFTVSADQKVTAITVGYSFGSCSGSNTYSNLNLAIGTGLNPSSGVGFGFGSGSPEGPSYVQVYGSFASSTTASGTLVFGSFPGCGNAGGIWTATKR
jgi:hypothetical protein